MLEHRYRSPRPEAGTTCLRSPDNIIMNSDDVDYKYLDKDLGVEVLKHFQFIIPHQSSVNEVLPNKYELR